MRLFLGIVAVLAVIAIVMSGADEDYLPKVCPTCGVEGLVLAYTGHGKPKEFHCRLCGGHFVQQNERLVVTT